MPKQTTTKTTIELDKNLFLQVKKRALEENTTLKKLITESLRHMLSTPSTKTKKIMIGGHHLGGISGDLSRTELYEDL